MKEYLVKNIYGEYKLTDHHSGFNIEHLIEVPEKYDAFIELNSGEKVFYKWHTNGHCLVDGIRLNLLDDFVPKVKCILWRRDHNITGVSCMPMRESLNDKIATAEVARQESKSIDATLAERQSQYGSFEDVAFVTENIMATLAKVRSSGLHDLPHTHRMALYMIASKMARIVNGDFNHLDSWHDIGGYSKLIEDLITLDQ